MDVETHLLAVGGSTTYARLQASGCTDAAIASALRSGMLVRVRRGSFIAGGDHAPGLRLALASVAVARQRGDGLSHGSALAAWGLPTLGTVRPIELYRPGAGAASWLAGRVVVRRGGLPLHPLPTWPDVGAVAPAAAVVQLAETGDVLGAVVAGDAALHASIVARQELVSYAELLGTPRTRGRLNQLLESVDARSESPGESILRTRLAELGVRTTPQVRLGDEQGLIGRVDLLDEHSATVYEFDGALKYSDRSVLLAEKRREDRLRRQGYGVVRVTWDQLAPARLAALIPPTGRERQVVA